MRSYLIAVLAILALVVSACAEGDGSPAASPTGTGDLDMSFGATASPDATTGASPTESAADMTMDASPTESPGFTSSPGTTSSPSTTDDATATSSPDDDGGLGGTAGMTCEESFGEVPDLSRIDSLQQLSDAFESLETTIESCESVDEWTSEAEAQLDLGNLGLDAEQFIRDRCDASDDLSETAICQEV